MSFGLPEEVVLLGLDDATGKCLSSYTHYSWNAGVLAELAALRKIDLSHSHVLVIDGMSTGDDILDEALTSLRSANRKLAGALRANLVSHGRDRTLQRLVDAGILEYHDNRVLGIFHFRRYPAHDGKVEVAIRDRLRAVVLTPMEPDARSLSLLAIAANSNLLHAFMTREERRSAHARIADLTQNEPIGRELRRIIDEDESAATTATIIAATS
ncbi:MAG: GPP34 family phosphoprotein [Bryobacteraceae bacterium]|nr:GPP34 family phosphoprotein [Bryobacteraceae bacterium]